MPFTLLRFGGGGGANGGLERLELPAEERAQGGPIGDRHVGGAHALFANAGGDGHEALDEAAKTDLLHQGAQQAAPLDAPQQGSFDEVAQERAGIAFIHQLEVREEAAVGRSAAQELGAQRVEGADGGGPEVIANRAPAAGQRELHAGGGERVLQRGLVGPAFGEGVEALTQAAAHFVSGLLGEGEQAELGAGDRVEARARAAEQVQAHGDEAVGLARASAGEDGEVALEAQACRQRNLATLTTLSLSPRGRGSG